MRYAGTPYKPNRKFVRRYRYVIQFSMQQGALGRASIAKRIAPNALQNSLMVKE
jgi:hypothetical protein